MDCSSITLAGITMDCAPSLGGIKRVWLTQYKEGLATLDAEGGKIASFGEATWYEYQFRKGTGSMTSTLTVDETAGTNYVTNELALVFTKMETAKRMEIAAMSVGHLCAVVEDSNGKYWFLGYDDYVSASAGTGVEDVVTIEVPVKVIENGQLMIIRGENVYNVLGAQVK